MAGAEDDALLAVGELHQPSIFCRSRHVEANGLRRSLEVAGSARLLLPVSTSGREVKAGLVLRLAI